ncbi:MAG: ankyrin repeat domain-containing protein [Alphaproteobacteria bacterium]|nr:ankyrin repeat domain-containing protein [Alphaproteobacteria bacterium]
MEKVLAASIFLGEGDAHVQNIGVRVTERDEQGNIIAHDGAIKIDPGRSGYLMCSNIEDIISSFKDTIHEHEYSTYFDLKPEEFANAIKEISTVQKDEVENLLYNRIGELNKAKKEAFGEKSLGYIDFSKATKSSDDKGRIVGLAKTELMQAQGQGNAADILVGQFTKQLELFKDLDKNIELLRKIDLYKDKDALNNMDLKEFFEAAKDPIYYAFKRNLTIDGNDPIYHAFKNNLRIDGNDPIDYCIQKAKNNKSSLLHYAVQEGDLDFAKALIDKGADLNAANNQGETPLHIASKAGNLEVIDALAKAGADLNAADKKGETPLTNASKLGNLDTVNTLIKVGADVNVKNKEGNGPFYIAFMAGDRELALALSSAKLE